MAWIEVTDYGYPGGWAAGADPGQRAAGYCRQLEEGRILLFPAPPFDLAGSHRDFLLGQRQADTRLHKNISYRPGRDVLRGFPADPPETLARMQAVIRAYSAAVTRFLEEFLHPYAGRFSLDYASFRPLEEAGRKLPLHQRNDLLHVDAFPSRPTRGGRILRVFTNLHPTQPRVWAVTEPFHLLAAQLAPAARLQRTAARAASPLRVLLRGARRALRAAGLPVPDRTPYDQFMLGFHDYLKESAVFQQDYPKTRLEFPAGATWLVFTDGVPHAVLSGRFALEQTYILPPSALLLPDASPLRILESLCGRPLAA